MTNADVDGSHIQVLLMTFFYKYMKPLIEIGKLYIVTPPLYKIDFSKGEIIYVYSDDELKETIKIKNHLIYKDIKVLVRWYLNFGKQQWIQKIDFF